MWMVALLLATAQAACPEETVGAALLEEDLSHAYAAYAVQDVPSYVEAYTALATHLACLDEILDPPRVGEVLLFQGVHAALTEDPERARRAYLGARAASPGVVLPEQVTAVGGMAVEVFATLGEVPPPERQPLHTLSGMQVFVNGVRSDSRPIGLPALVQVQGDDGAVAWTAVVGGDARLPEWIEHGRPEGADRGLLAAHNLRFVRVEPGTFLMENPRARGRNAGPTTHRVRITRPYLLGDTEVTQDIYEAVMGSNPSGTRVEGHPVEQVSWIDAVTFCNRLSRLEGLEPAYERGEDGHVTWDPDANGYRLPTEAEWEYAARAGQGTRFSGSDKPFEVAWYAAGSRRRSHVVGLKEPNAWGLYDMSGNVHEWVWDHHAALPAEEIADPRGPEGGTTRVYRGGAFDSDVRALAVASRARAVPTEKQANLGFRLARTIPAE